MIVTCKGVAFYAWPDRTTVPFGTSYPGARQGDAFGVIGGDTLTNNGMNLTETTIDVVQPFGAGKHYWVPTACIT